MTVAKKFVLRKVFDGEPKSNDLSLEEENMKEVQYGEVLVEAEYISVDPYVRPISVHLPIGATMVGFQVAKIIESKNDKWPIGKRIVAFLGWRTHTIFNPDQPQSFAMLKHVTYALPEISDLPSSLALGMLGLPGNSAYFGFIEICKPQAGETVVVSSAAGAIGSHVGQIAKILGLKVIGITDSDTKCQWLTDELNFDHALNYKKIVDLKSALEKAAPNGVDVYFDNVGGEISSVVIHQMNDHGRVSVCGSVSCYKSGDIWKPDCLPKSTVIQPSVIFKSLKIEGFFVTRWYSNWFDGIQKNLAWIREGKLIYRETITEGFENTFQAFSGVLRGDNIGKAIVKI